MVQLSPESLLAVHRGYEHELHRARNELSRGLARGQVNRDYKADYGMHGESRELYAIRENGVAEIAICGPLMNMPEWIEEYGYCSYERIRKQVMKAQIDDRITAIRLVIDSPGGTVSGCYETQRTLSSSAKPIIEAEVRTIGASAAYLLACTAQKILIDSHSSVGSVGTIMTIYGEKKWLQMMGISRETFVSAVSPFKNDDPEDVGDEGRARLQSWINKAGLIFAQRVSELRGAPLEKVLADYGKGDVLVGAEAIAAGVADGFIQGASPAPVMQNETGVDAMKPEDKILAETDKEKEKAEDMESTGEEPQAPETDAAAAERERLQAIDGLRLVGFDDLVTEAKYGQNRMTVDQLKARVFDAQRDRMASASAQLQTLATADQKSAAAVSSVQTEVPPEKATEHANREAGKAAKKFVTP